MAIKLVLGLMLFAIVSVKYIHAVCSVAENREYSYEGRNGPSNWGGFCNVGKKQSPIDIQTNSLTKSIGGKLGYFSYRVPVEGQVQNNGHSIQITPNDDEPRAVLVRKKIYKLQQFHFHFGSNRSMGSEHTVDGRAYAMEMHLVHSNSQGELAVVGLFFEETSTDNKNLATLVEAVNEVEYEGNTAALPNPIDLDSFLPKCRDTYYRYDGSLTTPPCTENVIWTVLRDPIPISTNQMQAFRKQRTVEKPEAHDGECYMANNFRPVQPLNGRKVTIFNHICH